MVNLLLSCFQGQYGTPREMFKTRIINNWKSVFHISNNVYTFGKYLLLSSLLIHSMQLSLYKFTRFRLHYNSYISLCCTSYAISVLIIFTWNKNCLNVDSNHHVLIFTIRASKRSSDCILDGIHWNLGRQFNTNPESLDTKQTL